MGLCLVFFVPVITKSAENACNFARPFVHFSAAREGLAAILRALDLKNGKVLLPAYIGWSPREGSGVFDPIAAVCPKHSFYALDDRLRIDLDSVRCELQAGDVRVFIIIHYFGYVDPCYAETIQLAREHGAFIIEDAAHAMLTDLVGNRCGKLGDACLYSFHKMLPVQSGGAAIFNDPSSPLLERIQHDPAAAALSCGFDLNAISAKRRAIALRLDQLVRECDPDIEPLFGIPSDGEVPQTYPVMIRNCPRNRVYHEMNNAGFGVVSLYHTLISQIPQKDFPGPVFVSRHILNLPVHQDVPETAVEPMIRELTRVVRKG